MTNPKQRGNKILEKWEQVRGQTSECRCESVRDYCAVCHLLLISLARESALEEAKTAAKNHVCWSVIDMWQCGREIAEAINALRAESEVDNGS